MRHPLHPLVVHFPIVFWTTSTVLDILGFWFGDRMTNITGMLLLLGIATAILAMFAGLYELDKIKKEPVMSVAKKHLIFASLTCVLYTTSLFMRIDGTTFVRPETIAICLSILGFICLCLTGLLGGNLVYKHGVGVERDLVKHDEAL